MDRISVGPNCRGTIARTPARSTGFALAGITPQIDQDLTTSAQPSPMHGLASDRLARRPERPASSRSNTVPACETKARPSVATTGHDRLDGGADAGEQLPGRFRPISPRTCQPRRDDCRLRELPSVVVP